MYYITLFKTGVFTLSILAKIAYLTYFNSSNLPMNSEEEYECLTFKTHSYFTQNKLSILSQDNRKFLQENHYI